MSKTASNEAPKEAFKTASNKAFKTAPNSASKTRLRRCLMKSVFYPRT